MTPNDMIFGVPPGSFHGSVPHGVQYIRAAELTAELTDEEVIAGLSSGEIREWLSDGDDLWLQVVPPEFARRTVHGIAPDPSLMREPLEDEIEAEVDDEPEDDDDSDDEDSELDEDDDGSEIDDED